MGSHPSIRIFGRTVWLMRPLSKDKIYSHAFQRITCYQMHCRADKYDCRFRAYSFYDMQKILQLKQKKQQTPNFVWFHIVPPKKLSLVIKYHSLSKRPFQSPTLFSAAVCSSSTKRSAYLQFGCTVITCA